MRRRRWVIPIGVVLVIGFLAAATGAIHAKLYGHDIFFLLDNGWRALNGQRVHVDYASGWGPVTFLLIAAGLWVSGASVAAVTYANAMAAVVLGLWAAWLAGARSKAAAAVLFPCFVALLVAAPFALSDAPIWTSQAMVYNRYGYALVAVMMLEAFTPPACESDTKRRNFIEAFLTGCALGLVLFLKVTYFLVGAALVGTSLLCRRSRRRRALVYAAGFIVTTILFLGYLRFDIAAMVRDLADAGAARSGTLGIRGEFRNSMPYVLGRGILLGVLALACSALEIDAKRKALSRWRSVLIVAVVSGCDGALLLTNAQRGTGPLAAACALLVLFSLERAVAWRAPAAQQKKVALGILLIAALVVPIALTSSVGLLNALWESRMNPNPPGVLRFELPRLRPLVLYDLAGNVEPSSNGVAYVSNVNEGVRLLVAHTGPNDKVTTLDMFNPFAYALGRAPIRGGIAAAAYRYTLDEKHHPSPERFFADAAVVMVPKYPASTGLFYDGYRKIYEPALHRDFRLAAESPRWWMYRRATRLPALFR